jgi:hypothetical protein
VQEQGRHEPDTTGLPHQADHIRNHPRHPQNYTPN